MTKQDYRDLEVLTASLRGERITSSLLDIFDETLKVLEGEAFALAGALALHAYVQPRMTEDIDFIVMGDFEKIAEKLEKADFIKGTSFNLNQGKPGPLRIIRFVKQGKIVDLMIFEDQAFAKELLKNAISKNILGNSLKVLSPDGLALTKLISFRNQDVVDLSNLLPQLNKEYLSKWCKKLGVPQSNVDLIFNSKSPVVDKILRNK